MSKAVTIPLPIAMPGTHQRFLPFFNAAIQKEGLTILDVGAGHGAFSKVLHEAGHIVQACDFAPSLWAYDEIPIKQADITVSLPYPDNHFDALVAIEVLEHLLDHETFFKEAQRILKPGGKFFASTPNILSLKSRLRFFWSGFFYSFNPLDHKNHDGLQHVCSRTLDQYNYLGQKGGFKPLSFAIDKKQNTSRWLLVFYPFMWLFGKLKGKMGIHNNLQLLTGRLLFLTFEKYNAD